MMSSIYKIKQDKFEFYQHLKFNKKTLFSSIFCFKYYSYQIGILLWICSEKLVQKQHKMK